MGKCKQHQRIKWSHTIFASIGERRQQHKTPVFACLFMFITKLVCAAASRRTLVRHARLIYDRLLYMARATRAVQTQITRLRDSYHYSIYVERVRFVRPPRLGFA